MSIRNRIAVTALTLSLAGFGAWIKSEGESPMVQKDGVELLAPHIPTKGDVPTIGHGSTRYEDGTRVTLADPPITRERAQQLARALHSEEERRFQASLPGVKLYQEEYDLYIDFTGQYGIGSWRASPMRRELIAGNYSKACNALLQYRFVTSERYIKGWEPYKFKDGKPTRWRFDCATPGNKVCHGVWTRQLERHAKCWSVQ
ncbi:lysozyme [Pseudomonas sp. 905_Psudmo1]|nr:lysozyme [Pseudomonas sp. 905_Psudmo1]WFS20625.1 lysozyme [Pseudomonas sp. 905_Psudmo1]